MLKPARNRKTARATFFTALGGGGGVLWCVVGCRVAGADARRRARRTRAAAPAATALRSRPPWRRTGAGMCSGAQGRRRCGQAWEPGAKRRGARHAGAARVAPPRRPAGPHLLRRSSASKLMESHVDGACHSSRSELRATPARPRSSLLSILGPGAALAGHQGSRSTLPGSESLTQGSSCDAATERGCMAGSGLVSVREGCVGSGEQLEGSWCQH